MLLLLAISLVPMGILRVLDYQGLRQLGLDLGQGTRNKMVEKAGEQLELVAYDGGTLVRREVETLETVLKNQAFAVEQALASDKQQETPIYWCKDFDLVESNIPGLKTSSSHFLVDTQGKHVPLNITYEEQVNFVVKGVDENSVTNDITRLAQMPAHYRRLRSAHDDLIQWQYTALESGVHTSYPGHGGYPDDFDPRKREWYTQAITNNCLTWNEPIIDASTKQVVITISMPVHYPDGTIAGVTAIDVIVLDLMETMKVPTAWSADARTMFVQYETAPADSENQLVALAHLDPEAYQGYDWNKPIVLDHITSPDEEPFAAMLKDMQALKSGYRQMLYNGTESLWAYGPIGPQGSYLLVVVPLADVIATAVAAEQSINERISLQWMTSRIALFAVAFLVLILALCGSRAVTRPVAELASTADRLANGDFSARADVHSRDEIGQLGKTFNDMVPKLVDQMRMSKSLEVAKEVQQHLLPDCSPEIAGMDVCAQSVYCDETGGDYFDFIPSNTNPHQLGIAVGDVTGHGIAAALLMATSRAILRTRLRQGGELADIFNDVNQQLSADASGGRFMTMFYLLADADSRTLYWTNAGHDPAITYDLKTGEFGKLDVDGGIPLGVSDDWNYKSATGQVSPNGQIIVIGTDGIWEARNPAGDMFGKEALRQIIKDNANQRSNEIAAAVIKAVRKFSGTRVQEDDITLAVIKFQPEE